MMPAVKAIVLCWILAQLFSHPKLARRLRYKARLGAVKLLQRMGV